MRGNLSSGWVLSHHSQQNEHPLSLLVNAQIIDYPSFVNAPSSWRNNISYDQFVSWDFSFRMSGVQPILVNGMFVCGFHCSGHNCLLAVLIFSTASGGDNPSLSMQMVWSANRNNPVEIDAPLQITPEGVLTLKDVNGVVVWSPNTAGKSVSRLKLSAEGNLMLFDKTNDVVWPSFDHPADTLVHGQRLVSGQKLTISLSTFNSSEGLYASAIVDGKLTAYIDADPYQIYYLNPSYSELSYVEFQSRKFGSFAMENSSSFIQMRSNGHLRAYEWIESRWQGNDVFEISRCSYPLACGKYGICSEEGCSCPDVAAQSQTTYFRPIDNTGPDDGCSAISPISWELSLHQSLLEIQDSDYFRHIYHPFLNYSINDSKKV